MPDDEQVLVEPDIHPIDGFPTPWRLPSGNAMLSPWGILLLELPARLRHGVVMSKVEKIEAELQQLSAVELQQVRDWLDNLVEDKLEFTPEFEADIQASEREMSSGLRPRVRQP